MDVSIFEENDPCSSGRGRYATKYTKEDLSKAIESIRSNQMSYGEASIMYNVPKTTLFNTMKNPEKCLRGATTILTKDQEDELAEWVLLNQRYGDPRTKLDIQIAAGQIAGLDTNVSKHFKNDIPTTGWVEGFLKRHPNIVYRKPETLSKASSINTKEDFAGLWRNIYDYFERTSQLDLLDKPEHWWNADETSFAKDVVPQKVLARRGAKKVYRREMGNSKDKTTVTYAFSADGNYVEPLITLKDSNCSLTDIAFALGSVGANYGINQTESGWTKTDSFYYFVTMHLHRQWEEKKIPKPRILTIDGYRAHFSLRLFHWSRLNDVIIIVLYPGGTPFLQMCDTTMFSPMKSKQKTLYSQWRLHNPTKTMNDVEFVKLLKQVNDEVIKKETIVNGWRGTGLQPFDFNNLNTDSLVAKSPDYLYNFKGDILNPPEIPKITTSNRTTAFVSDSSDYCNNHDNILTTVFTDAPFHETIDKSDNNDSPYFLYSESQYIPDMSISADTSNWEENHTQGSSNLPTPQHVSHVIDQESSSQVSYLVQPGLSAKVLYLMDAGSSTEVSHLMDSGSSAEVSHLMDPGSSVEVSHLMDPGSSAEVSHLMDRVSSIQISNDNTIMEVETQGHEIMSNCVTLSSISGGDGIFRGQFDTSFDLTDFGLTTEITEKQNGNKISKLVDRMRHDARELGLLCAATKKQKLINVVIINQQLNIIDQPEIEQLISNNDSTERTIKTILKPPIMPQRAKPKQKRKMKVAYGVVTSNEVIDEIERQEADEVQHENQQEQDQISKHEREKQINDIDEQLRTMRKKLSLLRSENAAITKEVVEKKKAKQDIGDTEDAKKKRLQEIKETNDQVSELRENLNELKASHVAINKAVALKKKQYLEQKKEGNVIKPSLPPTDDIVQI